MARIRERSCVRVLSRFINKLAPGSVKNVQTSTMPFKQMENIGAFQAGAKAYGCSDVEVFQTAVRPLLSLEPGLPSSPPLLPSTPFLYLLPRGPRPSLYVPLPSLSFTATALLQGQVYARRTRDAVRAGPLRQEEPRAGAALPRGPRAPRMLLIHSMLLLTRISICSTLLQHLFSVGQREELQRCVLLFVHCTMLPLLYATLLIFQVHKRTASLTGPKYEHTEAEGRKLEGN